METETLDVMLNHEGIVYTATITPKDRDAHHAASPRYRVSLEREGSFYREFLVFLGDDGNWVQDPDASVPNELLDMIGEKIQSS